MSHAVYVLYRVAWSFISYPPLAFVAFSSLMIGIILRMESPAKFRSKEIFVLTPIVVPIVIAFYSATFEIGNGNIKTWERVAYPAIVLQVILSFFVLIFLKGTRIASFLVLFFLFCVSFVTYIEASSWVTGVGL